MKTARRLLALGLLCLVALQLSFALRIGAMAFIDPPSTSFQRSEAWRLLLERQQILWSQQWVPYEQISPHLKRAVKPLFAARKGAVFSLGLRGKLVVAGAGIVAVEVDRVRQYPGGGWLDVDPRAVELSVPLGTTVPSSRRPLATAASRRG